MLFLRNKRSQILVMEFIPLATEITEPCQVISYRIVLFAQSQCRDHKVFSFAIEISELCLIISHLDCPVCQYTVPQSWSFSLATEIVNIT